MGDSLLMAYAVRRFSTAFKKAAAPPCVCEVDMFRKIVRGDCGGMVRADISPLAATRADLTAQLTKDGGAEGECFADVEGSCERAREGSGRPVQRRKDVRASIRLRSKDCAAELLSAAEDYAMNQPPTRPPEAGCLARRWPTQHTSAQRSQPVIVERMNAS